MKKSTSPPPQEKNAPQTNGGDATINSGHTIEASWGGIIGWFAHNHVAANILMMLLTIGGIISVSNMRTETFPSVDPRLVYVSVSYPGATPYEIADSITSRVEEALIGIDGVKRVYATASEGHGSISVELKDFADGDTVYNDVETAVNSLSDFPPENAERPTIKKIKVTQAVLKVALFGDVTDDVLKYWTETLEDEIQMLPEVSLTSTSGILDYQISVEASESQLRHYGLSLQDIGDAIAAFSVDIPAGTIESYQGDISLRIQEKRYNAQEFEHIALRTLEDGSTLYLGDVAQVIDGFEDQNLISEFNGKRASFITINRSEKEDTLIVAQAAKDFLGSVDLPHGLDLAIQQDRTFVLKERINLMLRNGILGFVLVFLVLLLFLDLKLAFWTSIAIPVSFLGGLMIISLMGFSINMVSLFALIVVLGIVVDDAIVMGESIFDAQEKYSDNPHAVMHGVKRVIAPVFIGVATTIAAFAPLIFSTGTMGQIIRVIPIAVIPILCVSLLEAFLILPSHLESYKRWSIGIVADIRNYFSSLMELFISKYLIKLASIAIQWRYVTIAIFIGFAIITSGLLSSGTVRFIFFPAIEGNQIDVSLKMPSGTPFETTRKNMITIKHAIADTRQQLIQDYGYDLYESTSLSIGEQISNSSPASSSNSSQSNNIGGANIQLISSQNRDLSASKIEAMIRKRVGDIPNAEELTYRSSMMGDEPDIEVDLAHPDHHLLVEAADSLQRSLKTIDGTTGILDSFEAGKSEYVFELNQHGLAVGLTPAELGQQLRSAFFGLEAQRLQRGASEVLVYVRYPKHDREDLTALSNARIRLSDGRQVPLSDVANVKQQAGYSSITTVDGRVVVTVQSDVDYAITTPNDVINKMTTDILPMLKREFPGLTYSFEGESREQKEDMQNLSQNMLLALMIIYVLLGAQLRSYVQPIVVMSAIPFGIIGAIWGHFFLGHDLSFISFFGIIALSGVVVNASVVLMDYYNMQILAGYGVRTSLLAAIERRFRPIILTTLTTSLGLLPMLLEQSTQARFLIPMVISLAIGIIFSTVIILLFIPCLVMVITDIKSITYQGCHIVQKRLNKLIK